MQVTCKHQDMQYRRVSASPSILDLAEGFGAATLSQASAARLAAALCFGHMIVPQNAQLTETNHAQAKKSVT